MSDSPAYTNHVIAVYSTHDQAEAAIRLLNESGIDMKQLSVVGQNYHSEEQPLGFVNAGDRMLSWGKFGAFWGAIWGMLFGSAMVFVPPVGYLLFAGWIVSVLGTAVVGGAAGVLGGALASVGVPNDTVVRYETALKAGSFLLIAHGDGVEVEKAKQALTASGHAELESYSTPTPVGVQS